MRVRRTLEFSVVNERCLKISCKSDSKIKRLLSYRFSRMSMAMSKLSSVIVMECSSWSASPVRENFKCCSFWLFVSLVLSITALLNKSKNNFHSRYPTEKTGKISFGKFTFTSIDQARTCRNSCRCFGFLKKLLNLMNILSIVIVQIFCFLDLIV